MSKQVLRPRLLLSLVTLVIVAGGVAALTVGNPKATPGTKSASFAASGVLTPIRQAPPLALHNYLGQPVDIASYRGKAVLVTFLYTNCPDICPLITSQLRVALNQMGAKEAAEVQIIAVSVDPKGDTPKAVAAFLARHEMTGRMQYLIGSARELSPVWQAWGVGSERDAQNPQFINHSGVIYGVSGTGERITVYAPSFEPSEVIHDVPLLAAR